MLPETRDDFEVAIICALPLEAAAVLDLFDQRYDKDGSQYGKQEGDTNTYSTERVGRHDIVLAHMPEMGKSSAASVASGLRLSFRGIRLALIVGICGAAPLDRPLILGDVIISNSVVEFDFGRQYPDRFERKSGLIDTLGRPNTEIRGLLSKFEVPLIRKDLEETILQNLVRLQEKRHTARYPGAEHDRLFAAACRHMHRQETSSHGCSCVCAQPTNNSVCDEALKSDCDTLGCNNFAVSESSARRARLALNSPTPLVHIGTIGSANTVMKSGEHRDAIARDNNIIAFEMEGAGVWDNLPCIVIKGICDYADSHKNKLWQDYAAATAASAAKAFLDHWTSRQHKTTSGGGPSRKRRLSRNSEDDFNPSDRAHRTADSERQNAMTSVLPMTDHTSTGSRPPPVPVDTHARKVRLDALAFEQLDARHATIKDAHAATCEWLLSKSEYRDWQSGEKVHEHHGFLWIKGKPGAGKSTIMKFAYTNAKKNVGGSVVMSYFFNARGESLEKSTIGMYRSLGFQLLSNVPRLQEVLDTNEVANLQTVSPDLWTTETLQLLFRRAIEKLEDQRLLCFVDALDECENNEDQVREMVGFFEALGECASTENSRFFLCFSSRHYPHITIDKCVELILEAQQGHSEDITKYINSRLKVGRSKRAEQIKSEMHANAQGVFLWVVLVVPMLQKAYDHGKVHELGECLKGIPKGLDKLFEDILRRDAENMENLKSCLKWILYADRPLSPEELYFAILSTSNSAPITVWDPEEVTAADINILSSSKGLAEATKSKTPTIQFIHESVRDFLLKESGLALQADIGLASAGLVHDFLKHSCQQYLVSISSSLISIPSSLVIPSSLIGITTENNNNNREMSRQNEAKFPFLKYSIHNVFKHAESAVSLGVPQEGFLEVFPLSHWIFLHDSTEKYGIRHYGCETSLLYILVERNLLQLFQIEVCRSQSINVKGGRYCFAINAAAVVGNEQILEQLLRHGANHTQVALQTAVDNCNAPVIAVLLNYGAVYRVPPRMLERATRRCEVATMKLLLENHSLLELPVFGSQVFENLVGIAIKNGDQRMLNLFLEFGVISKDNYYRLAYALYMASSFGNEALVKTLVELGADVNAVASHGDTALGAASRNGYEAVVRSLIEEGADIDASHVYLFGYGNPRQSDALMIGANTALCNASAMGRQSVVYTLLELGADVKKESPLLAASSSAFVTITRILLEHGANPNTGKSCRSSGRILMPLHVALKQGEPDIVRLLLDYGADVNMSSFGHKDAFSALDSCPDQEKRAACEQVFREKNVGRPQAPYLTWVDGVAYLNAPYNE